MKELFTLFAFWVNKHMKLSIFILVVLLILTGMAICDGNSEDRWIRICLPYL